MLESNREVVFVEDLGFATCRLSIAIPKGEEYKDTSYLNGKKIATIHAEIHEISGSVEIAPGIGLADAICDIVSSGSTLFMNGLQEAEMVLKSRTLLIKNNDLSDRKQSLLDKLLFRIQAVKKAKNNKYILLNAPNGKLDEIISMLPGMRSPTVLPLAEKEWSSVHSVLNENDFWEIIERLKAAGAQGILVIPIEKMII
jgi:ATP phosphoribosyltransferase